MNPEITKIIEQYLHDELSNIDRLAFEKKLSENETLRKEVDFHKKIHEASKRLALKGDISSAAKNYHLLHKLIIAGLVSLSLALATGVYYVVKNFSKVSEISLDDQKQLEKILNAQAPIDLLPTQYFQWKGNDTVFVSPKGVLISVPKNAFLHKGNAYQKAILIQYQEAIDVEEIVKSGLSTMSGDQLLETQGMFGLKAFTESKTRLDVNPKVGVYIQVPVDEIKKGMMLFEGKEVKNGQIDWQNPKKLEKLPTLAKMKDLNFYPPNYENELDKLQQRKDKKYRDSLYLSMEEFLVMKSEISKVNSYAVVPDSSLSINQKENFIFNDSRNNEWTFKVIKIDKYLIEIEASANLDVNGFNLINGKSYAVDTKITNQTSKKYTVLATGNTAYPVKNGKFEIVQTLIVDRKINEVMSINFGLMYIITKAQKNGFGISDLVKDIEILIDKNITSATREGQVDDSRLAIQPSKVLAFWNPKFDNTNLATRDFERRMQEIFKTCDPAVLALYTKNLNLSLSEIDAKVVKLGYKEFQHFADENIGKIANDNKHLENLSKHYEQSILKLKSEAKELEHVKLKKEKDWNEETNKIRNNESKRSNERNSANFNQEIEHNTESVYKQLGKKRPELRLSVGFTITSNVSVYNIDRFVYDKTSARNSGEFYDKETGKTAKLIYNKLQLKVEKIDQFERVFVYLFPSKLNSFHRLNASKGTFEYSLNSEFDYDLAIVAFKNGEYYFHSKKSVPGADLGQISLDKIPEKELNKSLEKLQEARNLKKEDMTAELNWLLREKLDYVVQKKKLDLGKFRQKIAKIVFPCFGFGSEYSSSEVVEEITL